ncbi:MAG: hypothetical protein JST57_05085 [Bacteroidetes bacterium]|nr:hypothetical protein [Bacteroidota bacterium]
MATAPVILITFFIEFAA